MHSSVLQILSRRFIPYCLSLFLIATCFASKPSAEENKPAIRTSGIPFQRLYPDDEVGYIAPSSKLAFDSFGRIAVVREGVYTVLSDEIWINLLQEGTLEMVRVEKGNDNKLYFGARCAWGRAVFSDSGKLRPHPLLPRSLPPWTQFAFFDDIICTTDGVYFGSWYGTVFLRYGSDEPAFFEVKDQHCLIRVGERVYAATTTGSIVQIQIQSGDEALRPVLDHGPVVEHAIRLDATHALVSTSTNELLVFDGTQLRNWSHDTNLVPNGRISAITELMDGNIAVAVVGSGLYIFAPDGNILRRFTAPRFRQIFDLACNEKGVLWLGLADSVLKFLYDCPLEDFGHELGLLPHWPVLAWHENKVFVASEGILNILESQPQGETARFTAFKEQPPGGATHVAGNEATLLVGNKNALYELTGKKFTKVADFSGLSDLIMITPDLCMVLSLEEIAAFKRVDGHWLEACKRIPGVGYSPIAQGSKFGMIIEMASNGAALATYDEQTSTLSVEKINPWPDAYWTSASVLDDLIFFTGLPGQRSCYDPRTKKWSKPAALEAALNQSEQWIVRLAQGEDGTLWATTNKGIVVLRPDTGSYKIDTTSFDFINAFYPFVRILANGEVWFTANQSLYRADTTRPPPSPTPHFAITSALDTLSHRELMHTARRSKSGSILLGKTGNNLSIRLFSGTYYNRRPPGYLYRLNDGPWTAVDSGSLLSFRDLNHGTYDLEVKPAKAPGVSALPLHALFTIDPPWCLSVTARILYTALFAAGLYGIIRFTNRVSRRRSAVLEKLVSERTSQLETTMERLNEETRAAATLAERNRLAAEIHDSLQQGLSGAILQLDSTMNLAQIDSVVQKRLNVARNMISFTRYEVQNAIWDKESPYLADSELGDAIHRLIAFINTDETSIQVQIEGTPRNLPTETKHHLMRIAQEATTNAIRHAKASRIDISLIYTPSEVVLEIRDDGIGFNQENVVSIDQGHFGLRGLRSRAKRLGAQLDIASAPTAGTKISVRLTTS
ncbi:MAG: sensor histidine kinase [Verrucomicrobia bacterium]|nr:sensor histidine kinase [Verrucomicrobiota bacterium]